MYSMCGKLTMTNHEWMTNETINKNKNKIIKQTKNKNNTLQNTFLVYKD
jgi:hypothetical protein